MNKNKHVLRLVSFIFICSLIRNVSARDIIQPTYKWEVGTEYSYILENKSKENENLNHKVKPIKFNLSVLNYDDNKWVIAVSGKMFKSVMFVSMNEYGNFNLLKIAEKLSQKDLQNSIPSSETGFLNRILSLLMFTPLTSDNMIICKNGLTYQLGNLDKNDKDIVDINVIPDNPTSYGRRIIQFNIKRCVMSKQTIYLHNSLDYAVISLVSIKEIAEGKLNELRETYQNALTEDENTLKKYRPMLTKGDMWKKQKYFSILCHIKNKNILKKLFNNDFVKLADGHPFLCSIVDSRLYDNAMSGESWAIEVLLNKDRYEKMEKIYSKLHVEDIFVKLQNKIGHKFGNNSKKWKEWFKRVQKIFPKLEKTNTEKLKNNLDNKDPWVRLFALNMLIKRLKGSYLEEILKNASHDQDKQVSKYAKEQLDNLKEE